MNNTTYVKTPTFIVNANGRVSESLRPDDSKGLRKLVTETRNFESLKAALAWINKEGQKKSTNLYLFEIRPATQGAYNVRCAIDAVRKPMVKAPAPKTNATKDPDPKATATSTITPNNTVITTRMTKAPTNRTTANRTTANRRMVNRKSN